jgi:GTP-binding protein
MTHLLLEGMEKKSPLLSLEKRLIAESETNVAITFSEAGGKESFEIGGRGRTSIGCIN